MDSILIIAGENSGEKYGAALVREFKKLHPPLLFFGIGGKQMDSEGVELLYSIKDLAVVGVFEILTHIPRIRRIFSQIKKEVRERKPLAAVLIDSPDFNLRLAKVLKRLSIPVLYYISPTVWAWRKGRLDVIKRTVTKMLLIFPFEESVYREHNIPAEYIGHPLKERVRATLTKKEFFEKYGFDPERKLVTLLPGSRESEIRYHMPVLMNAAEKIGRVFQAQFVLPLADNIDYDFLSGFVPSHLKDLKILPGDTYNALVWSDLALSSCGTANLEAALLEIPFVGFYRLSPITYRFGVRFVRIKNYSIVNILAGARLIPELIQNDFTPEALFHEAEKILTSAELQSNMKAQFRRIKEILGEKIASQNAARELKALIEKAS